MTRRLQGFALAALAGACLVTAGTAAADDARWTIDWSSTTRAQEAERVLDALERAFAEALAARPNPDVKASADLLVSARTEHDKFRTQETSAWMRVKEGRERVDRDTRLLMDRRMTTAWASLKGTQRTEQLRKEDRYLRTIRTVTRNRERVHQETRQKRERVSHALQAFALSWGELAVGKSAGNGMSLSNDVWLEHMGLSARSFNEFVRQRYTDCAFVSARPTRTLRGGVMTRPPTTRQIPAAPARDVGGFPPPSQPGSTASNTPDNPWDPAPQPSNPAPVQPADPVPAQPKQFPSTAAMPSGGKVESIGGFKWYYDFAQASAIARSQGKLLLALATKPNCTMCDKVKQTMVPTELSRINQNAVGFIYDIMTVYSNPPTATPDEKRVNAVLRGNLPNATLMPLVGFITPDKQWVSGFSGYPNQSEFSACVNSAARR